MPYPMPTILDAHRRHIEATDEDVKKRKRRIEELGLTWEDAQNLAKKAEMLLVLRNSEEGQAAIRQFVDENIMEGLENAPFEEVAQIFNDKTRKLFEIVGPTENNFWDKQVPSVGGFFGMDEPGTRQRLGDATAQAGFGLGGAGLLAAGAATGGSAPLIGSGLAALMAAPTTSQDRVGADLASTAFGALPTEKIPGGGFLRRTAAHTVQGGLEGLFRNWMGDKESDPLTMGGLQGGLSALLPGVARGASRIAGKIPGLGKFGEIAEGAHATSKSHRYIDPDDASARAGQVRKSPREMEDLFRGWDSARKEAEGLGLGIQVNPRGQQVSPGWQSPGPQRISKELADDARQVAPLPEAMPIRQDPIQDSTLGGQYTRVKIVDDLADVIENEAAISAELAKLPETARKSHGFYSRLSRSPVYTGAKEQAAKANEFLSKSPEDQIRMIRQDRKAMKKLGEATPENLEAKRLALVESYSNALEDVAEVQTVVRNMDLIGADAIEEILTQNRLTFDPNNAYRYGERFKEGAEHLKSLYPNIAVDDAERMVRHFYSMSQRSANPKDGIKKNIQRVIDDYTNDPTKPLPRLQQDVLEAVEPTAAPQKVVPDMVENLRAAEKDIGIRTADAQRAARAEQKLMSDTERAAIQKRNREAARDFRQKQKDAAQQKRYLRGESGIRSPREVLNPILKDVDPAEASNAVKAMKETMSPQEWKETRAEILQNLFAEFNAAPQSGARGATLAQMEKIANNLNKHEKFLEVLFDDKSGVETLKNMMQHRMKLQKIIEGQQVFPMHARLRGPAGISASGPLHRPSDRGNFVRKTVDAEDPSALIENFAKGRRFNEQANRVYPAVSRELNREDPEGQNFFDILKSMFSGFGKPQVDRR